MGRFERPADWKGKGPGGPAGLQNLFITFYGDGWVRLPPPSAKFLLKTCGSASQKYVLKAAPNKSPSAAYAPEGLFNLNQR